MWVKQTWKQINDSAFLKSPNLIIIRYFSSFEILLKHYIQIINSFLAMEWWIGLFGWIECALLCLRSWWMSCDRYYFPPIVAFKLSFNLYRIWNFILDKFRFAGQNIARRGNTKGYENTNTAIKKMVSDWFTEYKDASMKFINSYHNHPQG